MDTCTINILSICSGYGGIELGLHAALAGRARTVCYVENELSVASILAARMADGSLNSAPIWTNLRSFDPGPWRGKVDILAGGFPCQPHSTAGKQLGEDDPRELSGEVLRIAKGLGYPTLFLENVPGILRFYWDSIRPELREMGYQVKEGLFTAAETGAPHKRERLFILANSGESGIWDQARTLGGGTRIEDVRQGDRAIGTVRSYPTSPELADAGLGGLCQSWNDGDEKRTIRANLTHVGNTIGSTTQWGGSELADADSGLSSHEEEEICTGGEPSVSGGSELAHANQYREIRNQSQHREGRRVEQDSKALAHANQRRIDGGDIRGLGAEGRETLQQADWTYATDQLGNRNSELAHARLPLYPPGPSDHAGWAYLLSIMPTVEPTFCRDAHGTLTGVDRRLRAIGNGVIPAVAALAFTELSKQMER